MKRIGLLAMVKGDLAAATAYTEAYVSHAVFGHQHHHFFCGK